MKKKPPIISKEDRDLFRESIGDVRPLESNGKIVEQRPKPLPRRHKPADDTPAVLYDSLSDPLHLVDVATSDELQFSRNGVQPSMLKKLRRGQVRVEAELDLHRMTADEARRATAAFIQNACQRGLRCIRIIHGKGLGSPNQLPVLKTKVNHWLKQCDEVLAFCSARPNDGGTGAAYILLRAKQSPDSSKF